MAKRSVEVSRAIAIKTNVTKWTNAIENQSGGTKVYELIGVDANSWEHMHFNDKWHLIAEFKKGKDYKLERNKRTFDYEELVHALAAAKEESEKARLLDIVKKVSECTKAEEEVEHLKKVFEKSKKNLADAKEKLKKLEEEIEKLEL